jgi:hypothetical protein
MRNFVATQCSRTRLPSWMSFKRVDTPKASSAQACDATTNSSRTTDQTMQVRKIDLRKSVKKIVTPPFAAAFSPSVSRCLRRSRGHGQAFLAARKSGSRTGPRPGLGSGSEVEAARHGRTFLSIGCHPSRSEAARMLALASVLLAPRNATDREAISAHTSLESPSPGGSRSRTGHLSLKEVLNPGPKLRAGPKPRDGLGSGSGVGEQTALLGPFLPLAHGSEMARPFPEVLKFGPFFGRPAIA